MMMEALLVIVTVIAPVATSIKTRTTSKSVSPITESWINTLITTTQEIKRYSIFLKEHISIIDPKIIILMGSTAMEAVTGLNDKITNERGKWNEIILKNKTYPIMITFSPSYLIRFPENKKFSWEDLKKIRQKIKDLNITI